MSKKWGAIQNLSLQNGIIKQEQSRSIKKIMTHNNTLHLTAIPLRSIAAGELSR